MIIPDLCCECNDHFDIENPKVAWMKDDIVVYFHCKNPLCTRVLYTSMNIKSWMRVWLSGDITFNKKKENVPNVT